MKNKNRCIMRRALSVILALLMLLTVAPLTVFAEETETYKTGDVIEFGSYPQSEVTDDPLKNVLLSKAGSTDGWTSYNYYIENVQSDFMKYADVEYNGVKYRGVYFTQYRPECTTDSSSADNSYQDDNGYSTNTVYWFKYDTLFWKVLSYDKTTSSAIVLSVNTIDSREYYHSQNEERTDEAGGAVYANNYENSDIRAWLNDMFYNTSFNDIEKNAIVATELDNSAWSADYSQYDSSSTTDNVWLISYSEAQNADYGFMSGLSGSSKGTAYALCQGLFKSSLTYCSRWHLRSAGGSANTVCNVTDSGAVSNDDSTVNSVNDTSVGIRPALKVKLETCNVGDTVTFGSYPQSEVTDASLKATLSAVASSDGWKSYSYYAAGDQSDYMVYTDVTYSGEKYRGVCFSTERPYNTRLSSSSAYSFQDENGYNVSTIYWFKFEPIKWKVLSFDRTCGEAVVLSKSILDAREYYNTYANRTIDGKTIYANDYAESGIRAWLGDTFYNTAFDTNEKSAIITTTLDNKAYSDDYAEYDSNSTSDNVWLLSYDEVQNFNFGFTSDNATRQSAGTAYAYCQGLSKYTSTGYSFWRLRSAGNSSSASCYVNGDGIVMNNSYVCDTDDGVRPALKIDLRLLASEPTSETSTDPMPVPAQKPVTEPKTSYNVGDIFEFGSYPQSEVTDDAIKAALTAKSGSTDDWTSYNYYVSSAQSDYMKYTDVEYNGEKYRGVYFTIYRPCVTRSSGDAWNSAHYYNGYSTLTQYWFRYDPIKWQVLSFDSSTGNVIAMSKSILDSQQFYHYSSETRTIGGKTVYPNNYEHSDIRAWLNDAFYNTAFGETEKKAIIATTLDNSAYSADYKEYNSDSTTDNVWHLSYSELQNADYGFASNESASETRQAKGTAYAFCQGLEKNSWNDYSVWRSRTAGDMKKSVVYISSTGKINRCYDSIRDTNDGVRPALKVHLAPPVLEPIPVPTTNIDSTTNNVKPTDPVLIPTDDVPPTVDVLPTDYAVPTDDVAPTDYVPPTEDLAPTTEDSTTEPETEPATKPTAEPTTVPTTESTIEPTTAKREPITETVSPTEQEQTTISIDDVIASVAEKVDAVRAAKTDDGASALIAVCGINAAVIRNAASGSKIVDKDGKEVSDTAPLATGMKIVLDGETVEIAVLGDVDGNGEISVTDARLALRQAVSLENLKGVYLLAAKLGSDTVSVSEARKILRAAVGLDDSKDWLK